MALTKPQGNMVMKLGTEQATTSGTSIDFTGIPAGTTRIVVMLEGVSTNGSSNVILRIGDSGGGLRARPMSTESRRCSRAVRTWYLQ